MSDESLETDYSVQLTLTCLYNVCHEWAASKPSQPGNEPIPSQLLPSV